MSAHYPQVSWPSRTLYRAAQRLVACDISRLMLLDRSHLLTPDIERRFTFRLLESGEVKRYAADFENELTSDLAERIQAGRDLCYAAFSQQRLAAYIWLALGSLEAEHNRGRALRSGVAVSFPPDVAFVYKAFTRPEVRGQRLYPAMLASALDVLESRGVSRLLTTADWTNRAALNSCSRIGFQDLGTIVRFACGPAGCTFKPGRALPLGIRLGRQARVESRKAIPLGNVPDATPSSSELALSGAAAPMEI
jgi:GNAT superfamily N-acetyltransferase